MKKTALLLLLAALRATAQPTISAVSPMIGIPGSAVTITGTGFNTTPANDVVYFGATKAAVTSASATSLTVTVPIGANFMPVSVNDMASGLIAYSDQYFLPTYDNSGYLVDTVNFDPKVTFTTGGTPEDVEITDIDGDGKADIIVGNSASNTISVYRNISSSGSITSGSFAAPITFVVGDGPSTIAIGDIDGDGKPDLAIAIAGGSFNTVSVLHNTSAIGSLSFDSAIFFATGSGPYGAAISDIDGDGRADVIIANLIDNTISVLRNTSSVGSIGFEAQVIFAVGNGSDIVAVGDIDGDGKPDLAIGNQNDSTISILRNTSSPGPLSPGTFSTPISLFIGGPPAGIAIVDIDGDGKLDLAATNGGTDNTILVFRNISSAGSITAGSFEAPVGLPLVTSAQECRWAI